MAMTYYGKSLELEVGRMAIFYVKARMPEDTGMFTSHLERWVNGDVHALDQIAPAIYQELRLLARRHMRSERAGHTLQSTALVNEAFMRMLGGASVQPRNRTHFIAIASRLMRQVLVDYARTRNAQKRDGGQRVDIEALAELPIENDVQLVALDEAIEGLARVDERQSKIVEMKFFGGLTTSEIGEVLGLSVPTIERDWAVARLWLHRHMDLSRP
jgi:RNA polymerase sigma factor (TIGR02999 family)